MNLGKLFNPRSVAVLGASPEEGKVGNVIAKNLLTLGYAGETRLINQKYDSLFGRQCYRTLASAADGIDLAVIAIPAKFVVDEIRQNADKIKNFVVISAGFSETGDEGRAKEEELAQIASQHSLNIIGPNCLGLINPALKLNASFAGGLPPEGNIAFVSQSGALAVAMMDAAADLYLGFSLAVSIGNKAVIDEADLLDHLAADSRTKVIGMYLESIKNGRKFMAAAARAASVKPVIILKSGQSERAQKAIASHTGALAGSDQIISAAFAKVGAIRAQTLEEFADLLKLASLADAPAGKQTVVITNAGGPGVLAADAFAGKNLVLAEISEKAKAKLAKILPPEGSSANPIDLLGDAKEDRYKKTLDIIRQETNPGAIIAVLTPQDQTPVNRVAAKIVNFKKKTGAAVASVFIGGTRIKRAVKKMEAAGIPNFRFPENAVDALDKYYAWGAKLKTEPAAVLPDDSIKAEIDAIISKAKTSGRLFLSFSEGARLLGMFGIGAIASADYQSGAYGGGFPAAIKVDSGRILHRTDQKALILGIKDQWGLDAAAKDLGGRFSGENLIVQPMLECDVELIIGLKQDPAFGPVIICGLGGIYAEVFREVDFFMPPLRESEIAERLESGRISFLFRQTRSLPPVELSAIAKIILGLGRLSLATDQIKELDINPLMAWRDGKKPLAADIKIVI